MVMQPGRVVIGMDPHKRSVTIEVMAADEAVVGGGRFATDPAGFKELGQYVRAWPDRVWAIEGCNGIGRHVALRLLAEGQDVVDVPPKLGVAAKVCQAGQPAAHLGPGDVGLSGAQGQGVLHGEHGPGEVTDPGQARRPAGGGVEDVGVG